LDDRYRREDGQTVLSGKPDPELRFAIQKSSTLIGKGKRLFIFTGDDAHRRISVDQFRCREPIFDCNDAACYFIEEGLLFSLVNGRKKLIDEVLKEQTRIWVGPRFGFGFYVAGEFKRAFLFTSETAGRKLLDIDGLSGNLLKVACRFTERQLWLLVTFEKGGQIFNRATVFADNGCCLGSCEKIDGSGDWMDGLHRSCAASLTDKRGGEMESLLVPSSNGVVRIEADGNLLRVAQVFPETENLLEAGDRLLYTSTGLYAWNSKSVRLLNIG
jgi:hypothetical protein